MSRGLSTNNVNAIIADTIAPISFVELDFSSGFVRVHSAVGTINWGGYDWLGVGTFGSISAIEDSAELQRQTVSFNLSGIPTEMMSIILGENYQGRSAKIYLGFLDLTTHVLTDTPALLYIGKMDVASVKQGKEMAITLTAESRIASWNRPITRRYTNAEQQKRFTGDKGLEYIDQAARNEISWGRKSEN